jgi:hypothetical protein
VVALFVVRKDPALTEQAIKEFCHQYLTGYKRPQAVYFRDELPKTNVGKILRRALRDELAQQPPKPDKRARPARIRQLATRALLVLNAGGSALGSLVSRTGRPTTR